MTHSEHPVDLLIGECAACGFLFHPHQTYGCRACGQDGSRLSARSVRAIGTVAARVAVNGSSPDVVADVDLTEVPVRVQALLTSVVVVGAVVAGCLSSAEPPVVVFAAMEVEP